MRNPSFIVHTDEAIRIQIDRTRGDPRCEDHDVLRIGKVIVIFGPPGIFDDLRIEGQAAESEVSR